MIYDITDPANAAFMNYFNSRDYSADIRDDVSPEGLAFVAADKNNSGLPVLILSNEVSGTVSVMAMEADAVQPDKPDQPSKDPEKPQEPSKDNVKPAGGSDASAKTGDSSNIILWITLLFVSGSAVAAVTVFGRKKI